jgi:hypothetical protein
MKLKLMLCVVLATAGIPANAVQPIDIPDIDIIGLDGNPAKLLGPVNSTPAANDLKAPIRGQWLILYIQSSCPNCDNLLNLLRRFQGNLNRPEKLMVVIGGMSAPDLRRYILRYPELAAATWRADPARNAIKQLKLGGAPVIAGCREGTVLWTMNGALSDSASLRAVVEGWTK